MITTRMLEKGLIRHRDEIRNCVCMASRAEDYKNIVERALTTLQQTLKLVGDFKAQEEGTLEEFEWCPNCKQKTTWIDYEPMTCRRCGIQVASVALLALKKARLEIAQCKAEGA